MKQPATPQHQVVAIAHPDAQLQDAKPRLATFLVVVGNVGLLSVKAHAQHHATCAAPLDIALAESRRKGESFVVEGIVGIEVDSLLAHLSLVEIREGAVGIDIAVIGLRRQIDHIETECIAVGIEVQLIVLALSGKFGGVDGHADCNAPISHSHAQCAAVVGLEVAAEELAVVLALEFDTGSREVGAQLYGPPALRTHHIERVVARPLIAFLQQLVTMAEMAVNPLQPVSAERLGRVCPVPTPFVAHNAVAPLQQSPLIGGLPHPPPQTVGLGPSCSNAGAAGHTVGSLGQHLAASRKV